MRSNRLREWAERITAYAPPMPPTCPGLKWQGPFGPNEQLFGVNGQISKRALSD